MANNVTPSPCGVNASLDEAKAAIDDLKAKISQGLDSIGDLGSIADTIKQKLSEVNIPQVENVNLQAELAKLPYLSPAEYNAQIEKIKNFFGKSVENLDEIIEKIPKPPGLSSSSTSLFQQLQDLAAGITTTTQNILDSLTEENIANAITDLCNEVPNIESQIPPFEVKIVTDSNGNPVIVNGEIKIIVEDAPKNEKGEPVTADGEKIVVLTDNAGKPVLDGQGDPIATTIPAEKPAAPVTPQKNPKPEPKPTPPPVGGFTFAFTKDKLVAAGGPAAGAWFEAFASVLPRYGITTPDRVAAFVAQIRVESGNFTALRENLRYREKAYFNICKNRLKLSAVEECRPYLVNEQIIATGLYERMLNASAIHNVGRNLGNTEPGDGHRFIGRGLKQLTGRFNYTRASRELYGDDRLVRNPDLVATDKNVALETACWFWKKNNLSAIADAWDITKLSKRVNGGTIGLEQRLQFSEQARKIMNA
jgi:putative chitinase